MIRFPVRNDRFNVDLDASADEKEHADAGDSQIRPSTQGSVSDLFSDSLASSTSSSKARKRNLSLKKHSRWTFTPVCKVRRETLGRIEAEPVEAKTKGLEKDTKIQVLEEKLKNLERVLECRDKEISELKAERQDFESKMTLKVKEEESKVEELENKMKEMENMQNKEVEEYVWQINLFEREKEDFLKREEELIEKLKLKEGGQNEIYKPRYAELMKSKEKYKSDAFRFHNENRVLKEKLNIHAGRNNSIIHVVVEKGSGKIKRSPMVESLTIDNTQQVCAVETDDQICQHISITHGGGDIKVHRSNVTCV